MRLLKIIGLCGIFIFLSGCASKSTTILTSYAAPARVHEATQVRTVAVLPFKPLNGDDVTPNIEMVLTQAKVNDQPFFRVVERTRLNTVMNELALSQSGMLDPNTVTKVGKLIGVAGIYTGAVTKAHVTDQPYAEERSECVKYVKETDKKGKKYETCARYKHWSVDCVKRTAHYAFIPKLIDANTGVILYSRELGAVTRSEGCADSPKMVEPGIELLAKAKNAAIRDFTHDVSPHMQSMFVKLLGDDELIANPNDKALFNQGMAFAKANRLDRACSNWISIPDLNSPDLIYNQGVCMELLNTDLQQAKALYLKADQLSTEPIDAIYEALARIAKREEESKKLSNQLSN